MRFIKTNNSIAEFIETDKTGKIISSRGFQFGVIYFEIKNKKVAFYLDNDEQPFQNFVWSTDIPLTIDDVEYETEEEVSAALHSIFNDRFQEQLDQLKEDLAAEEARAQEAEEQLDDKIDDESARAIAAENRLQNQVTELSGTVATFDGRITNVENGLSALTNTVNGEITRSTAKDAEHDTLISGLTDDIASEIARATARENALDSKIDLEIANRIADVDAEEARAIAAESGITANLNSEISRSTEKDAQHDAQISALTVSLSNEINRATTAENSLRSDLNAEIADRISGDTNLQNQLNAEIARAQNAEEDIDDKIDAEIARANSEETKIERKLDNEITRSTAKDVEHDALISGLTDDLASEVARATTRENQIDANLNAEIARATNAENALDTKIDNEITRSTAKDASHDTLISGLTTNLQNEINRATSAENAIRSDLNTETSARTNADAAMLERIVAVEVGKADANSVYTKAESDAKYATKDYISGLTDDFFDDVLYDKQSKRINFYNGNRIKAFVDASDFVKDGMVSDVRIVNNNLVITFNTDAGKDAISIPLTDIFDPANYYTKGEVDSALLSKADKTDVITISGDVIALSTKVDAISGEVNTIKEEIDDIDLSNYYTKSESDGKYQLKGDYVTGAQMSAYTYDKQTIDDKIASGGTFDPTQYYNKTATDALLAEKADTANTYTKSEVNGLVGNKADATALTQVNNVVTAHIANTTVHVTSAEKNTWNNKSDFSGNYNDLTNKPTIHTYTAGTGIDITNDVISVTGGSQPVDAYTKAESDAKFATITNFNLHSGNTTMHVTSAEKATWNAKADASSVYNKTEIDNKLSAKPNVWCGNESEWSAISGSTESGTIYLVY